MLFLRYKKVSKKAFKFGSFLQSSVHTSEDMMPTSEEIN